MRTPKKNGLLKSLSAVLVMVLAAALLLTGCSDKVAQEAASVADSKAAAAQSAADAAKKAANEAKDAIDAVQGAVDAIEEAIAQLPTAEDVAEAIEQVLNDYVKGDVALGEETIITYDELVKFLQDEKFTAVLEKYAEISVLEDYAKAEDLEALEEDLADAKADIEADIDTLLNDYFTNEAAEDLADDIADDIAAAVAGLKTELTAEIAKKVDTATFTETLKDYYKKAELDTKFATLAESIAAESIAIKAYADALVKGYSDAYADATDAVVVWVAKIQAAKAAYEAAKADYTDVAYETIVAILWEAEIRVNRAQTATEVEALADAALDAADLIMTKAEEANKGAAFDARIVELLTNNGYLANATCLYSELDDITDLKDAIDEWFEEVGTVEAEKIVLVPNYDNLKGALTYATNMTTKYNEAVAENGIIAQLDAVIALRPTMTLDNAAAVDAAYEAYTAWLNGTSGAAYVVDVENAKAIITLARGAAFSECMNRIEALEDAKAAAVAINDAIAALDGQIKITSMSDIRVIRNMIVTWMNAYDIVPETNEESPMAHWFWLTPAAGSADIALEEIDEQYVAANYDMINHADLDELFEECDNLLLAAITDAKKEGGVIELIAAIDTDDAKMLYQYANFEAARKAYDTWAKAFGVETVNLATGIDFGTGSAEVASGVLLDAYLDFSEADTKIRAALNASAKNYTDNKGAYDAVNALTAITPYDGELINKAYKAATEWFNATLDADRAFNDVIKAIDEVTFLTEAEYNKIVAAKAEYDALVKAAIAAGNALKQTVDAIEINVYSGDQLVAAKNTYDALVAEYGITAYSADLDANLMFIKDVLADLDAKTVAYNTLIAELKADIVTLTAQIDALVEADFTIYSKNAVVAAREAYNAFAVKAGLTDKTSAAYTAEIDDADILAFKAKVEALEADEAAITVIEAAKTTETNAVIAQIGALKDAASVTTADAAAIAAARAAYEAWLAGTNFTGIVKDAASYAVAADQTAYLTTYVVTNLAKLEAAEAALAEINVKLEAAEDLIADLIYPVDNDVDAEALENAIADAKAAVDAYYEADGGVNNGGLDNEILAVLAEAEMSLDLYNAKKDAEATLTAEQYAVFEAAADAQIVTSFKGVNEVTDEELLGTKGESINTLVNLFKAQLVELYNAANV